MKTYRIATIPGDGIGKEVVPAARRCWKPWPRRAALSSSSSRTSTGAATTTAARRDDAGRRPRGAARQGRDPVRLGRRPDIPDHITLWGLRLKICQGFDQYANVRPTRILPGIDGPLKRCKPKT
jgi:tartrate dehydrogenase/decarboxylase/D-malate dehydrogenase